MTQVPPPVKVTVVPDTVHAPGVLAGSTENTTGLPDPPPMAARGSEPPADPAPRVPKRIAWVRSGRVV